MLATQLAVGEVRLLGVNVLSSIELTHVATHN